MAEHQTATRDRQRGPLQETQEAIARGAEWWWQATRPFMPGFGNGPFSDQLVELVDKSFDWAGQVLDVQRDFTKVILAMLQQQGEDKAEPRARAKASAA